MYRIALEYLQSWKQTLRHKPLILRGARQVGKSTLVQLFAQQNDLSLLEINCERHPEIQDLFTSNEPQQIIQLLSTRFNTDITPGTTLLFLDEIQATPSILASLRYFYEEMPQLHIIAAGSLLEFALKNITFSMPVGRIEYMYLGPMTFSEFLHAMGEEKLAQFLQDFVFPGTIPDSIHKKLMQLTNIFCIVGGMPEAITQYVHNKKFLQSEKSKQSILHTYEDDFNKYSHNANIIACIKLVFNNLCINIGRKFKYSNISKLEKALQIATALEHVAAARVAYKVQHSSSNGIPLDAEVNSKLFKALFLDVGLTATKLNLSYVDLHQNEDLTLINAGAIAEQFIGQHLLYSKPFFEKPTLHYWVREQQNSNAEIDYVINHGSSIIPIEVKAGKTGTLKSLHYFLHEKQLSLGVRFNAEPPNFSNNTVQLPNKPALEYQLLSLPLYMVEQLPRLLLNIKASVQ